MSKTQKVYQRVTAELAKDPKQSVAAICKRLKFGESGAALYYNARRAAAKASAPKPKARLLKAFETRFGKQLKRMKVVGGE